MTSNVFSLHGRSLKLTTAADAAPHLAPLTTSTSITEAHLSGNTLGVAASEALGAALATQPALRVAHLGDIFTGRLLAEIPAALAALLQGLRACPRLETVHLSDNAFGLNTVEPLRAFLAAHVPLRHLYLSNNGLGPAAGTLVAEALSDLATAKAAAREAQAGAEKAEEVVPELETLVCGRNRLETGSMAAWAGALRAHAAGLREVRLVQNGIRPEGVATLLRDGLATCDKLRVLDLQDNTFTEVGARALAEAVGRWEGLRELGVGDCLLGARGVEAVVKALREGKMMEVRVLRLQYNEVDARGVRALAAAAGALPALRRVEVNGNRFDEGDEGVARLRGVLEGRREAAEEKGVEVEEGEWGLDELDELEEESGSEGEEEVEVLVKAMGGARLE